MGRGGTDVGFGYDLNGNRLRLLDIASASKQTACIEIDEVG